MPVRLGRCVNFGLCPKADARETITVHDGDVFNCPFYECGEPLQPLKRKLPWSVLGLTVAALLIAVGFFRWQSSHLAAAAPSASAPTEQSSPLPIKKEELPDVCQKTNWSKATEGDLLATNCVGKAVAAYNKRLDYVYSLEQVKDWSNVKQSDPRLLDCAGLRPCEQRARGEERVRNEQGEQKQREQKVQKLKREEVVATSPNTSCEQIREVWEPEDPRLSTATCGGLKEEECAHIERCLGLHPVNVGPGSSKSPY